MNRKPEKYCATCGAPCLHLHAGHYDTETGEPVMRAVCPTRECGHTGVQHEFPNSFFALLFPTRCTNCGRYDDDREVFL